MFFLVRHLKSTLIFSPHDMDKLHSQKAIIQMLRDKMQGLCFNDLGYIVKIAKDKNEYSDPGADLTEEEGDIKNEEDGDVVLGVGQPKVREFLISTPEVEENGIKVSVTFSAICFKAQKNDLIQFRVTYVSEDLVRGYIGPVEVVAPSTRIEGFDYKKDENIFISNSGSDGRVIKIDRGTKIRAKCLTSSIQFNTNMKIIVHINKVLMEFIENDYR